MFGKVIVLKLAAMLVYAILTVVSYAFKVLI